MICDTKPFRVIGSYGAEDYDAIMKSAERAGGKQYRIYRFAGVAPCGDEMWDLVKRVGFD